MTVVLKQAIEADYESDARDAFEVFENLLIVVLASVNVSVYLTSGIFPSVEESSRYFGIFR
jgi:hypothetical protein